jgi:hypothetical protein
VKYSLAQLSGNVGANETFIVKGNYPLPMSPKFIIDDGSLEVKFFLGDISGKSTVQQHSHLVSERDGSGLVFFLKIGDLFAAELSESISYVMHMYLDRQKL